MAPTGREGNAGQCNRQELNGSSLTTQKVKDSVKEKKSSTTKTKLQEICLDLVVCIIAFK
jgi:hypothetical protein